MARGNESGEFFHIDTLAKLESVPANYLVQIFNDLRQAGIVTSRRGKSGGYALARGADEITLLEVVQAIEGDLLTLGDSGEGQSGAQVLDIWRELRSKWSRDLEQIALSQLAGQDHGNMYYI